jgi:hypothetical protein
MNCCNDFGRCARGPGCPAGGACHGLPGCQDTSCPGHPGTGNTPPAPTWREHTKDFAGAMLGVASVIAISGMTVIFMASKT